MINQAIKIAMKIAEKGQYKLSRKFLSAIVDGKPFTPSTKEFNILDKLGVSRLFYKINNTATISPTREISPGIQLREELIWNRKAGKHGSIGKFFVHDTKKVPIVDIDFPDKLGSHDASQIIFPNKREALKNLKSFMERDRFGRESAFKVYDTPAGMRLFDVTKSRRGTPSLEYGGVMQQLGADDHFINWSRARGAYSARISPKPGRPGDFISKPAFPNHQMGGTVLAGPDAGRNISQRSIQEIQRYHDSFIIDLLEKQLKGRTDKITLPGLFRYIQLMEKYPKAML
jgi:hypothetical protein